jgi:hypothetical protein
MDLRDVGLHSDGLFRLTLYTYTHLIAWLIPLA